MKRLRAIFKILFTKHWFVCTADQRNTYIITTMEVQELIDLHNHVTDMVSTQETELDEAVNFTNRLANGHAN